jgi:hypothetical protein
MGNLSSRINKIFIKDKIIYLKIGGPYFYIGEKSTKINSKESQVAFE